MQHGLSNVLYLFFFFYYYDTEKEERRSINCSSYWEESGLCRWQALEEEGKRTAWRCCNNRKDKRAV